MAGYLTEVLRYGPLHLYLTTRLPVEVEEINMEAESGTVLKLQILVLRNTRMPLLYTSLTDWVL